MNNFFSICFIRSAGKALLLLVAIGFSFHTHSQIIEYSRQSFKSPYADVMRLVPNVAGKHHVLCFAKNAKVFLYVFSNDLQLLLKKEVPTRLHENDDVNITAFNNYYLLYLHQPNSTAHELWKIDEDGNCTSVTEEFAVLLDSAFKKNTATFQLINKKNRLAVIGNVYYNQLEKIITTVVEVDEKFHVIVSNNILFDFQRNEGLRQQTMVGDYLFILKTLRDSANHLLEVIKANVNSGEMVSTIFNSGAKVFSNPTLSYHEKDSTVILYSTIERTVFITQLDALLNQQLPVTLLKNQFSNNAPYSFLLLPGKSPTWLRLVARNPVFAYNGNRASITRSLQEVNSGSNSYGNGLSNTFSGSELSRQNFGGSPTYITSSAYANNYSDINLPLRLSLLKGDFSILKDSLIANEKNNYSVDARRFANAVIKNKSYLFLGQRFGPNRQGILMVYADEAGELVCKDIRVYDKNEYLVSQAQSVNGQYIILPYTYKRELGLVKITLE